MSPPTQFVADTMLGKLARWLRILGYDTLYYRDIADRVLVQIARSQKRWLLTRDTILLKEHRPDDYTFVQYDHLQDQLRQVVTELGLDMERLLMRCLECNEVLVDLPREKAGVLVPPYVLKTQEHFSQCPGCKRAYWAGTHYQRICKRLNDLFPERLKSCRTGDSF